MKLILRKGDWPPLHFQCVGNEAAALRMPPQSHQSLDELLKLDDESLMGIVQVDASAAISCPTTWSGWSDNSKNMSELNLLSKSS